MTLNYDIFKFRKPEEPDDPDPFGLADHCEETFLGMSKWLEDKREFVPE